MSFWTFFGATWIGKGLIKVNLQACAMITIFTDAYLAKLLQLVGLVRVRDSKNT